MLTSDDPKYQSGDALSPEDAPPGAIISPDTRRAQRVPPGQARTRKWPVLHWAGVPEVPTKQWTLEVRGLVDRPLTLSWDEFRSLPRVKVFADFHCVTRWSRLSNVWEGVSTREILNRCGAKPQARFALPLGYDDGWTTNLPLEHFLAEDALFADTHDGEPLSADHGGPVRLIIPQLYAWKSAKWVKGIELSADDRPGLWEEGGYHDRGDPWLEERFRE
ncbi:MAG: sulfite oxidase-like oxidoreductase [Planctomycetaceae bacterium]|nr:sulfite oxidase-like oxidoreductase [Planctomycetaceae bacterium]